MNTDPKPCQKETELIYYLTETFPYTVGLTPWILIRIDVQSWIRIRKETNAAVNTLRIRIRDLGSGIRCLFDPWIRDPGWVKSQDPDLGSGMNNPDHIS
jgi:hypothetical protein